MTAFLLALGCALSAVCLILAESYNARLPRLVFKPAASGLFVLAALAQGGLATAYGEAIILGLALCAVGDILLLSDKEKPFLAGMGAFALGHGGYIAAFLLTGPAFGPAVVTALAVMGAAALLVLKWIGPHLGTFRFPVFAYVAVISAMVVAGIGASLASGDWRMAAGGVLFAVSDIAVARDRFVKSEFANRLWGLPLYYGAQILIASTV